MAGNYPYSNEHQFWPTNSAGNGISMPVIPQPPYGIGHGPAIHFNPHLPTNPVYTNHYLSQLAPQFVPYYYKLLTRPIMKSEEMDIENYINFEVATQRSNLLRKQVARPPMGQLQLPPPQPAFKVVAQPPPAFKGVAPPQQAFKVVAPPQQAYKVVAPPQPSFKAMAPAPPAFKTVAAAPQPPMFTTVAAAPPPPVFRTVVAAAPPPPVFKTVVAAAAPPPVFKSVAAAPPPPSFRAIAPAPLAFKTVAAAPPPPSFRAIAPAPPAFKTAAPAPSKVFGTEPPAFKVVPPAANAVAPAPPSLRRFIPIPPTLKTSGPSPVSYKIFSPVPKSKSKVLPPALKASGSAPQGSKVEPPALKASGSALPPLAPAPPALEAAASPAPVQPAPVPPALGPVPPVSKLPGPFRPAQPIFNLDPPALVLKQPMPIKIKVDSINPSAPSRICNATIVTVGPRLRPESPPPSEPLPPINPALKEKMLKIKKSQDNYTDLLERLGSMLKTLDERYKAPMRPIKRVRRNLSTSSSETQAEAPIQYPSRVQQDDGTFLYVLGPNGTKITAQQYADVFWTSAPVATRCLLTSVFTNDELATHTLTGKPSPAFYGRERPAKLQLNQEKIDDIIVSVQTRTKGKERAIRAAITTKCADVDKKYKRRALKEGCENKSNPTE